MHEQTTVTTLMNVLGDFVDTVKNAAEGVKTHGSNVASWVRSSVSPTLRNMLPTSSDTSLTQPASLPPTNASRSAWTENEVFYTLGGEAELSLSAVIFILYYDIICSIRIFNKFSML